MTDPWLPALRLDSFPAVVAQADPATSPSTEASPPPPADEDPGGALEPSHYLLVLGVMLIITSLMMIGRSRRRKQAMGEGAPKPSDRLEELRQRKEVRGDLERLMVDLEEMARRLGAQMDAKARRVEHLLEQAERRLAELRQAQAEAGTPGWEEGPGPTAASPPTPLGETLSSIAGELSGDAAAPGTPGAAAPGGDAEDLRQRVYALADAGADAGRIASELDEHQGKVELILSLRGAGGDAPG